MQLLDIAGSGARRGAAATQGGTEPDDDNKVRDDGCCGVSVVVRAGCGSKVRSIVIEPNLPSDRDDHRLS